MSFIPNAFQVPNAFVDEVMCKISDASTKIYLLISRKTRGWNKEMDSISLTQFEEFTGKSRPTIVKCLRELVKFGLVVEQPSTIHGKTYKLGDDSSINLVMNFPSKNILLGENKTIASKKSLPLLVKNFNHTSKNILPLLVKNFYTQRSTINKHYQNKKINKKSESGSEQPKAEKQNSFDAISVELPGNVNRDLWNQFVEMRKSIKKPLTENAVKILLKKLHGFGDQANEALETSIVSSYQSVYFPKHKPAPSAHMQNTQETQRRRFGEQSNEHQMRDVGGFTHG
ncbi:replication protein [Acinetobacter sp. ANC 4558]|uniref:replication protein n=1 Tax=Acinetobacter sp. ANC 4558 TaxID=1977876 RepID=UPI000A34B9E8|nr:replication protein [Acinetobacter sp. ANC 4558]OTG85849.1 replication protein [Acinetobacter sp. ANC 4558]